MPALPWLLLASLAAGPAEPALRLGLGVPLAWRSASVIPRIGVGLVYRSETPYAGALLDLSVAPLGALRRLRWLAPLELDLELSHRLVSVAPAGAGPEKLGAREQRASLDLVYPAALGAGLRLAGRAGYGLHRFGADQDLVPTSMRHGVRLGIDAVQRLPWGGLLADAFGRLFPTMGPGPAERAAFGRSGNGWGFQVGVGARGPISGPLGWRLAYDFLRFSDSYTGSGTQSVGGEGEASYHSIVAGVTFTR